MTRNVLAVTALCALLGPLTACSGSDGDSEPDAKSSASPSSGVTIDMKTGDCTADVALSDGLKASWSGEASAASSKGRGAAYTATKGDTTVQVLPKEGVFPPTAVVTVDGVTYSSQGDEGKIKADPKGGGASADADVVGLVKGKQKTVHVVAEFDC